MFNKDLAIDLGTSNIRIYTPNKGVIFNEPAVVAYDSYTDKVISMGQPAYKMLGRNSKRLTVGYPLVRGVISDFFMTEQLVHSFFKKVYSNMVVMPRVVVCIPGEITEVEKRALVNTISSAGMRKVCLIENPISSAIGAGIDIFSPTGSFVIDIGAGVTDLAVISLSDVSTMRTLKFGGIDIDNAIIKYVRRKYGLIIGLPTAEYIKNTIGCLVPFEKKKVIDVKGKDMPTGIPKKITLTSEEICNICVEQSSILLKVIHEILETTSPELLADIHTYGITLTGGLSQLYGIDKFISNDTNLAVNLAPDPQLCGVLGAGDAIKFMDANKDKDFTSLNPLLVEY